MKAFLTVGIITILLSAFAAQAAGFGTEILGFGQPIHQNMTRTALSFLKGPVLDDIVDEHAFVEVFHPGSAFHFDDCAFQDTTQNINALYNRAVAALNPAAPDLGDAPDAFGQLLHPVQDFYSHSNWVETGRRSLFDTGFGLWTVLTPFSVANGVVIIQGETIPAGFAVSRTGSIVTVGTAIAVGLLPGLISGTFGFADDCPDSIALSHGDLHKDVPGRPGHAVARTLATVQTTHEWCRLVNLVKQNYGRAGVQFLFDKWVADEDEAIAACPNADIAFVIDTTGSMFDDIAAVKASINAIVDALDQSPIIVRLALATYKDFPVRPFGGRFDFPFRADLDFTLGESIKGAVGGLGASGGGNFPESVYNALMETINGGLGAWRKDADVKAIILMGDAPPHDPEPFTGHTLATVLAAAFAADPIVMHTVPVGSNSATLQSFTNLAEGSGGGVFTAERAADVPQAILRAIEEILNPQATFLVIDEDSIGSGEPPNFFSDLDVNDHMAEVGVRDELPFFAANAGSTITLHTGEVGDEGWFALRTAPFDWEVAGPTPSGLRNYLLAGPGLGTPDANGDREALLDKIPDVTPLRATALKLLEGRSVCAVVYDSEVSINYDPLSGSLKGANLGTAAFRVLSVKDLKDFSSSSLPQVEVVILDADVVCEGSLVPFTEAPEPTSSSEPFDVSTIGPGTLFGGVGRGSPVNPGALLAISQVTGAGELLGDPVTPGGLSGIAFDSTGRLFGSTIFGFGTTSTLVEIDPDTGVLVSTVGPIVDAETEQTISIGDLSFQPGTDVLYGIRSNADGIFRGGFLYTIDTATGTATFVGDTGPGVGGGLAFAPDGTLYQSSFSDLSNAFPSLNTIDPDDASRITTVIVDFFFDGLGVRGDGLPFASRGNSASVWTVDPTTGLLTLVGSTGAGRVSDLDFRP